jgi:hypothetical protein
LTEITLIGVVGLTGMTVVKIVRMILDQPRCKHQWEVRARVVAEPIAMDLTPGGRMSRESVAEAYDTIERLNTGCVSVVLTCAKCGTVETRRMNGVPEQGGAEPEKTRSAP